ncbi:MAG: hypothetical protein ACI9D8_000252 [Reinekea sp.]|jgi:hypothetical protein
MKPLVMLCLILLTLSAQAKTSLYGQANGYAQLASSDAGSSVQLETHLSEFGFRGDSPVANNSAFFDLAVGLVTYAQDGCCPQLLRSELGMRGDRGALTLFYGDSLLARSNEYLTLMHRDPDALTGALGYSQANSDNLPVGLGSVDGLSYRAPLIADRLQFEWALMPAERLGGETGLAFAADYAHARRRLSLALELNGTHQDSQLMRLIGDWETNRLTVGAGVQLGTSSASDTRALTLMGFTRIPLRLAAYPSTLRWLVSTNRLISPGSADHEQYYTSLVQELNLTEKVSVYGFVELEWPERAAERVAYAGLGLNVEF